MIPPEITFYNMTSEGGSGCSVWNSNKSIACNTSDSTPTLFIRTNEQASCRIGISDLNYTNMGSSRECAGGGTLSHTCTLISGDALTQDNSNLYVGCKDIGNNENRTSTSGALKIIFNSSVLSETSARLAMDTGIQNALLSGYTTYPDTKIYVRNFANNQAVGTFDRVVKKVDKIWAFNYLTGSEQATNVFNITPALYVLDMRNMSWSNINTTVYNFISNTK